MICALCSMLMALLSLFFAFIEDGLSISAPGADLVVNDTTYKFGATNPATECIAADVILDFKSGRGFYESHSLIVNDNLSCKKTFCHRRNCSAWW